MNQEAQERPPIASPVPPARKSGAGKWILVGCGGLLGLVVLMGLCVAIVGQDQGGSDDAADEAVEREESSGEEAPEREAAWTEVVSWSGNGMKETETFETRSREWRISWQNSPTFAGGGVLQIYVYDGNGGLITLAANTMEQGSDVSYVRSDPGPHYLTISGANTNWTVKVEDQR